MYVSVYICVCAALYIIWLQVSSCNPALIFCKNLFMKSNACERASETARNRDNKGQRREGRGGGGADSRRYLLHSLYCRASERTSDRMFD